MSMKPGDAFGFQFPTFDGTGALANATGTPTGTMVRNGVDDTGTGTTVTVTNVSTGLYKATGTVPVGYVKGDDFQVRINATVGGVASAGMKEYGKLDSKRVGDLNDAAGQAIVIDDANRAVVVLHSSGLDAVQVESGVNARQSQALILAACAGKLLGAGTGTIVIKAPDGSTTRITATTDDIGNRTVVTLSAPT